VMRIIQPVSRSRSEMVFLSPSLVSGSGGIFGEISSRLPVAYNVSFIIDGVASVRRNFGVFRLLANPRLLAFKDDRKNYRGEILSLEVSSVLENIYISFTTPIHSSRIHFYVF